MATFQEIEHDIQLRLNKKINKFAKLVKSELDIDLKNVSREQIRIIKRKLPSLLKKAGIDNLYNDIFNLLDAVENHSTNLLIRDSKIDRDRLNKVAIRKAELLADLGLQDDLDKIEKSLQKRLRKNLTVNKLKKLSKSDTSKLINSIFDVTKRQTETATATAVMGYDRSITTVKANSVGLHLFKYAGADDSKNRKFCKKRVGKIYSDKEAKRWKNGQKEPAYIYLGGYNCRHRKVYLSQRKAEAYLKRIN